MTKMLRNRNLASEQLYKSTLNGFKGRKSEKQLTNSQANCGSGVCWQPKYGNNKLKS